MRLLDVILFGLGLFTSTRLVSADGSIGCLFSKSLCKPKIEWCFDDYAFGKCLPRYEDEIEEIDLYRYDLNGDSLQLLKRELERLMNLGYRWSHFYTQCVLKALLFAFRYQKDYQGNTCIALSEEDQIPALTFLDRNVEIDPKSVGQVQFTPSVVDPHAEYADEIYIPVPARDNTVNEPAIFEEDPNGDDEENYINYFGRAALLNEINKNKRAQKKNRFEITESEEIEDEISPNYLPYLNEIANEETSDRSYLGFIDPIKAKFHFTERYNTPDHFRAGLESRDYDKDEDLSILEKVFANDRNILKSFSRNYNTPERFRKGHETKDEVFYPRDEQVVYLNQPDGYFLPEERQIAYDTYGNLDGEDFGKSSGNENGIYTEGGVVYVKNDDKSDLGESNSLEDFMNTYNNWGFKRPERLDVKKPGPSFSTNNYAFKKENEKDKNEKDSKENPKSTTLSPEELKNGLLAQPEKKKVGSPMESPSLRKQTTTMQTLKEKPSQEFHGGYAYVVFKNKVNTWQEGSKIVRKLEDVLRLGPDSFSDVKVDENEVKFRVDPNRLNFNASDVVGRIESNRDLIQRAVGLEVVSTGVGDQSKFPTAMSLLEGDQRQLWILSFLLCGVIAALAIAGAALFVIKRHSHTKDKLQNLTQMDSEASKDYQDLCRARMATKTAQDKPDGNVSAHRVANLARESEGSNHSPSSRSSTSSWSEEPALTNMDISTGHMVLSYMEDHLKNKDRLEQEWIALCAYEAEPCATTIAVKEENAKKNRYNDVLPYDHARVVLNELSNVSGSDYINASTITDHDPRNPAYIATQGPLSQTAADFWQMVWEQGSVVMVMLTRLTENGTAMCHRYWPEEGSELYHIYEVHLVSEHIWCDDYLVRSFYLKNVKTGETRTVTQFHFLSWPENGIPLSTKALLEFRRKVNKSYRGRSCPIVVHCSDGVGRTGTYCLIDMVLNRMAKGAKEIDIAATLEHIRDQRPLMVRTKQQFEFVLMAVAEEVHAILKALPANPNHSPPPVLKEKE